MAAKCTEREDPGGSSQRDAESRGEAEVWDASWSDLPTCFVIDESLCTFEATAQCPSSIQVALPAQCICAGPGVR